MLSLPARPARALDVATHSPEADGGTSRVAFNAHTPAA